MYTGQVLFGDATGYLPPQPYDVDRLKRGNFIPMCSLLRTAAAREVGFDPAFSSAWGDYDLFMGLVNRGWRTMPTFDTWCERLRRPADRRPNRQGVVPDRFAP